MFKNPNDDKVVAFLDWVSDQLGLLVKQAKEQGKNSVELLAKPHMHSTNVKAVLQASESLWKGFGSRAIDFAIDIQDTAEGFKNLTIKHDSTEAREYRVSVLPPDPPIQTGLFLIFKVEWD